MRYDFMIAVSEATEKGKLAPAHLMQVREIAKSSTEAEQQIKARYRVDKRYKLEDIRFLGIVD